MNDVALKAAAFDAAGAGLEIRGPDGARLIANDAAGVGVGPLDGEANAERMVEGRARLAEARGFAFAGESYSVIASVDIDAQRRLADELFARAYFDEASGLPNRALMDRAVADMIAARALTQPFALVVVEIDRFAEIVAFHGAGASEGLIARIGERLAAAASPADLVARLGTNEFGVLVAAPGDEAALAAFAGLMATRASEPCLIEGVEIFAAAAAGVCLWPSGDGGAEGLRRKARAAAREARRLARAAEIFSAAIEAREAKRAREDNALRQAIRDRRIGCAFQPKMDFRAGEVDSLEVLMRWRDDEGNWGAPGVFLDLAQQGGLINEITEQVFEEALASLDAVNEAFGRDARLGFNIASRQACDTRFMRGFLEKLAASGHARRFMLEITEEAFLPTGPFKSRILPMIRETGAHLSIDDFGAGYSSLAMLADIEADEIKVDRSLIVGIEARPRSQSLLRAIESIGEALATEVMVEGVETEAELGYLREHTRIRVAQGYLFARPMMLSGVRGGVEWREKRTPQARAP